MNEVKILPYHTPGDSARIVETISGLPITAAGIRSAVARGQLAPAGKTPGGIWLFLKDDLVRFALKRRQQKPAKTVDER